MSKSYRSRRSERHESWLRHQSVKFGKGGPAEKDSTGRTDFKQEVTKLLEEQEVPQGASNGPQAKSGGRGSFNNQEDFTKIPSLPKLHFCF